MEPLIAPRGILFDMDGTLTAPMLDFDAIKREMGIEGRPILETLAMLDSEARGKAEDILHRHEENAAEQSSLNPGCEALLRWLEEIHLPTALVTRNTRKSVATVFRRHQLKFEVCVTREDGKFKPDPAPLLLACHKLEVAPAETWMVGDGVYDVQAGIAAGMPTIWISHGREKAFPEAPSKVVRDLLELTLLLEQCLLNR